MFEIKLCNAHGRYRCEECESNKKGLQWRACADCEAYSPLNAMVVKSDGRVICRPCDSVILEKQRQKAQSNLFVQQQGLF